MKQIQTIKQAVTMIRSLKFVAGIAIVLLAFFFAGCNNVIDHPISGKTYYWTNFEKESIYITFHSNGKYVEDHVVKTVSGYSHDISDHLTWEVSGNAITIRFDKSSYWKPDARGDVWKTGKYDPTTKTVILGVISYVETGYLP